MSEKSNAHGHTAGEAIKRTREAAANGVNQVTAFVARNDERVADSAQAAAQAVGAGLDKAGRSVAAATQQASKKMHGGASRLGDAAQDLVEGGGPPNGWRKAAGRFARVVTKTATHAVGFVADAATVAGNAVAATGRVTG